MWKPTSGKFEARKEIFKFSLRCFARKLEGPLLHILKSP